MYSDVKNVLLYGKFIFISIAILVLSVWRGRLDGWYALVDMGMVTFSNWQLGVRWSRMLGTFSRSKCFLGYS